MGKKIIGKTIMFVVMLGVIIGFSVLFGSDNTLIGVTTITAVLMLLEKDFSLNPISTTIKLICFNVLMGLVTFAASRNLVLGIPLNFIFLFITSYTLSYNLSTPSFVPFNLQYVFMLSTPVTISQLPMRLVSLIVGAVIIVLSQVLFNRNKIYKQGGRVLSNICLNLIKKIELLEENRYIENRNKEIREGIKKFRKFVYNRREQEFYLTDESRIKLDISFELEKIDNAINELLDEKDTKEALHILNDREFNQDLIAVIDIVKICLEEDENLNKLDKLFNDMFKKYNAIENTSVFKVKVLNSVFSIKELLEELRELDKKKYNVVRKLEDIPSNYKLRNIYKESFKSNSLRFSYAFKLALGVTITAFIVDIFKIEEGKWVIYTVNSLIQPFYETVKEKTKDRIVATIIGAVIISVIFYFLKGSVERTVSIMIVGYLCSFNNSYKYRTINATVSAIGAAAINGDSIVLTIDRIVFVIIGAVISLILSKFVFPYKHEDSKRYLIKLYNDTIVSQINIMKNLINEKKTAHEAMRNEILRANMIEDRLLSNEDNKEDERLQRYLEGQRLILMDVADLYRWIDEENIDVELYTDEKDKIDGLVRGKEEVRYEEIDQIINDSKAGYSLNNKIAIVDYIEILTGFNRVKKISI